MPSLVVVRSFFLATKLYKTKNHLRRNGRSSSRKRSANYEDGSLSYREDNHDRYARNDNDRARKIKDILDRLDRLREDYSRRTIITKRESSTVTAIKIALLGLALSGALVWSCCKGVERCDSSRQPRVAVNPVVELQHVQNTENTEEAAHVQNTENTEEAAHVQNTENTEEDVEETEAPPTYNTVFNETNDRSAIPPPSYDEVVRPG